MIVVNIDKAKTIAHDIRRAKRTAEFAPLDIRVNIPSKAVAAEAARQAVRTKYAAIQADIDAALNVSKVKLIIDLLK